jgi:tRNA(Ile)-lysidine synthase
MLATQPGPVLVACSGGADSLALAAATAFVAPRLGVPAGLVTVDHQLQSGSHARAAAVAEWGRAQGLAPVVLETISVEGRAGGPEAAAREGRYAALVRAAQQHDATTVLLGHTRDDQAETVLLALLRGAGSRGLAAMPARRIVDGVTLARPLLDTSRRQTRAACAALGLDVWEDPHNRDPAYARPRARVLLQSLVDSLGPAVVANLARTATLAAADAEALDALARAVPVDRERGLEVSTVEYLPAAVRTRVLHAWVRGLGVSNGALAHSHVTALDALITGWRGQGPVHLPGGVEIARRQGWLTVTARGGS